MTNTDIIDEILWNDWDPIGVKEIAPEDARDEYQSYVPQILNMAMNGNSIKEIADRLYFIETDRMCLAGNYSHCEKIAEKIKNSIYLNDI